MTTLREAFDLFKRNEIAPLPDDPKYTAEWFTQMVAELEQHIQEHLDWLDWTATNESDYPR